MLLRLKKNLELNIFISPSEWLQPKPHDVELNHDYLYYLGDKGVVLSWFIIIVEW